MAADPKRLVLLRVITDHLAKTISVENGYHNDLMGTPPRVYRGRDRFGDSMPLPCVSVLEGLNPDTDSRPPNGNQTIQVNRWVLLIQGWAIDDEDNPTDPAYLLAADVRKALALLIPGRFTGLVENAWIEAPVCRPPDEISSRAYFWLRLCLVLKDDHADPSKLT